jgi:hypothetical protein
MTSRLLARRVFLLTFAVICAGLQTSGQVVRHPIRVRLEPEMVDKLGGVTWATLTAECYRIWIREGVEIAWAARGQDGSASPDVSLPIVFDDRELRKRVRAPAFGVTTFLGREHRILVSITRARRLTEAKSTLIDASSLGRENTLGRLLGLAVAHEVGHALLVTTAHSTHGLMSPSIDVSDVGVSDNGRFVLSGPDRQRLAVRFSRLNGRDLTSTPFE